VQKTFAGVALGSGRPGGCKSFLTEGSQSNWERNSDKTQEEVSVACASLPRCACLEQSYLQQEDMGTFPLFHSTDDKLFFSGIKQ